MNNNTNVIWTVVTKSGETHVMKCRNTLGGWSNGLERLGLDIKEVDVDRTHRGLPESDRVNW